jgi:phosphonatase-like hydrolase
MNELTLVVFDMAGTTVLDRGEVPAAFTAALAAQGIEVTPEALSAVRGASKRQAILSLIPEGPQREARTDATYAAFKGEVARRFCKDAQPVPGAAETFAWLRSRGVKVALNTGFDRDITTLLIDALQWNDQVDAVVCGDDVSQGRPAPQLIFRCMEATGTLSVGRVAVVGDTVLDLQAGDNAGVRWNIGVISGAHSREKLERESHTHILSSVAELPSLFEKVCFSINALVD